MLKNIELIFIKAQYKELEIKNKFKMIKMIKIKMMNNEFQPIILKLTYK